LHNFAIIQAAKETTMLKSISAELAPSGKLRAGMNQENTLFTTEDAATGELRGVSVDLMRELA
jgi:polar amino acid transport system substrate-binding protein